MGRWVEFPAVSTERFVWTSAGYAFQDGGGTIIVAMAFVSAPRALLGILALECFVPERLIIKALLWAWPPFKHPGVPGLPSDVEESLPQKATRVTAFREVDHHGAIGLGDGFVAQPSNLGHRCLVLLTEGLCCPSLDISISIQNCQPVNIVHFNGIKLVPENSDAGRDLRFGYLFNYVQFGFVSICNLNTAYILRISGYGPVALTVVSLTSSDLFLYNRPNST